MPARKQEIAASPDAMRAQADQLNASARDAAAAAREATRAARAEAAQAAQLAHEAALIDAAAVAKAVHDKAAALLPDLEDKVAAALAAKRAAEDLRDADQKRLARRRAEESKAEADEAPAEQQEELAIRVAKLEKVVAGRKTAVTTAEREHAEAEAGLASAQASVSELYSAWAEASRQAENPGPAPYQPAIGGQDALDAVGASAVAGLAAVPAIAALLGLYVTSRQDTAPGKPDRAEIMRDQTRFRALGRNVIVPPKMPT